jgi:hypothetical protein
MRINIGIGEASISAADGLIHDERLTYADCTALGEVLERLAPYLHPKTAAAARVVSGLLFALTNDTSAVILIGEDE